MWGWVARYPGGGVGGGGGMGQTILLPRKYA